MLRVDSRRLHAGACELLVSGTLDVDQLPVMCHAVLESQEHGLAVTLNLSGLVGVDRAACQTLVEWRVGGMRFVGCPPFLRRWIRDERRSRIRERS